MSEPTIPQPAWNRERAEKEIRPLLSRANLMRLRSQWDEAIALCTEALRIAPESAAAHSLLGEIYEAQGKIDEALQWYGMAVDLAPASRAERERLERVLKQRQASLPRESPQPASPTRTRESRPGTERTLEWFDRTFPPGRSESIARLIFLVCGVLAIVLGIAAGLFFFSARSTRPPVLSLASPQPAPVEVAAGPATPAPSQISPAPTAPPGPTPVNVPGAHANFEPTSALLTIDSIWPEPLTADVPSALRDRILRSALSLARTAALEEPRAQRITVRLRAGLDLAQPGEPFFVGETSASAVPGVDPQTADYATLSGVFTSLRWPVELTDAAATPAPEEPPTSHMN